MKITLRKIIKAVLPYGITFLYQNYVKPILLYRYYTGKNKFHVYSIKETAEKVISDKCSMVRFGDGEMSMILGGSLGFQAYDEGLADRLREILGSDEEKLLVCIPDVFEGLDKYRIKKSRTFWMGHLARTRKEWESICRNKNYYNAFISRPYLGILDIDTARANFETIVKIWDNADVVLIEGQYSRLGCGNNLFDNVKSLKRILCPSKNAYSKYEKILEAVMAQDKNKLILISLGPAAKPLAFDLYKSGYRVLDIGHIDIEYEWYLRGAKEKIIIPGKYVNEVQDGDKGLRDFHDKKYEQEIIAKII